MKTFFASTLVRNATVDETEKNSGVERSECSAGGAGFSEAFANILDNIFLLHTCHSFGKLHSIAT
jgi:hypothetical protein